MFVGRKKWKINKWVGTLIWHHSMLPIPLSIEVFVHGSLLSIANISSSTFFQILPSLEKYGRRWSRREEAPINMHLRVHGWKRLWCKAGNWHFSRVGANSKISHPSFLHSWIQAKNKIFYLSYLDIRI